MTDVSPALEAALTFCIYCVQVSVVYGLRRRKKKKKVETPFDFWRSQFEVAGGFNISNGHRFHNLYFAKFFNFRLSDQSSNLKHSKCDATCVQAPSMEIFIIKISNVFMGIYYAQGSLWSIIHEIYCDEKHFELLTITHSNSWASPECELAFEIMQIAFHTIQKWHFINRLRSAKGFVNHTQKAKTGS